MIQEKKELDGEESEDDVDDTYIEDKDELDLDKPVNIKAYESVKVARNRLKEKNLEFVKKFKSAHGRNPAGKDLDEIREGLAEYARYNKKYILLKAKMIRQGVLEDDIV